MALSVDAARRIIEQDLMVAWRTEAERLRVLDRWWRWEHDRPHAPKQATPEYRELMDRAGTPWLGLVVTAVAQSLAVEGYRRADADADLAPWAHWQANRMDRHQSAIHRAALAYGHSYVLVVPGETVDGAPQPVMRGVDPSMMVAAWDRPASDEWPLYAMEAETRHRRGGDVVELTLYDERSAHVFESSPGSGGVATHVRTWEHGAGVCPVVRFANDLDLRGRTPGEVEPHVPIAGRIDQTVFDRLVVQRFASWLVRTISGMTLPEAADSAKAEKLRLAVEDILVAEDPDTKFDSLPATPLSPFTEAKDSDIRDLAAVTQTPPHYLLGSMVNLSAEALAAAEASLMRKVGERQRSFGESWESALRLCARLAGDDAGWRDTAGQVRWADMESRSMAQVADALTKLNAIGVPVEMLLEMIPWWSQQDVERATRLLEDGQLQGLIDAIRGEDAQAAGTGNLGDQQRGAPAQG